MILRQISQKNEVVCRDRGNFGAKSKSYDVTMKRASSIDELYIKKQEDQLKKASLELFY